VGTAVIGLVVARSAGVTCPPGSISRYSGLFRVSTRRRGVRRVGAEAKRDDIFFFLDTALLVLLATWRCIVVLLGSWV